MKKITLTIITTISVVVSFNSYSQTSKYSIGIESGPNISNLRGNSIVDKYDSRIGINTGLTFQYQINSIFSLKTVLSYETKGNQTKYSFTDISGNYLATAKYKTNFNYLVVPILFKASKGKKINYFVNCGPFMSILLKQYNIQTAATYVGIQEFKSEDNSKYFNKTDYGITSGLGIQIPLNKFVFSVEFRNNLGLKNIDLKDNINDEFNTKTSSNSLLLGFQYNFQ